MKLGEEKRRTAPSGLEFCDRYVARTVRGNTTTEIRAFLTWSRDGGGGRWRGPTLSVNVFNRHGEEWRAGPPVSFRVNELDALESWIQTARLAARTGDEPEVEDAHVDE
jgi:hypothetical protein